MHSANNKSVMTQSEKVPDKSRQALALDLDFINVLDNSDISSIIWAYLMDEIEAAIWNTPAEEKTDDTPSQCAWNHGLQFFDSVYKRVDVLKTVTASALIAGDVTVAIELIRHNPWLIRSYLEGSALVGKRVKNMKHHTPLQIAARLGDLNPFEMQEPFGAVEQLISLDLLSDQEIENQLHEVFFLGWDSEDGIEPLKAAVKDLESKLKELDIPFYAKWDEIGPQAEKIAWQFQAVVFNLPETETDFVFNQRIFVWFIKRFWESDKNDSSLAFCDLLGGSWRPKGAFFWDVVVATFQMIETACGFQMHCRGIPKVAYSTEKVLPDRSSHFSSSTPDSFSKLSIFSPLSLDDGIAGPWGGDAASVDGPSRGGRPRGSRFAWAVGRPGF